MRFYEYEAREIVRRAGIPVTDYGFTRDPAEAARIAARIGGPVVIKSQVLTGGRMKAGGIQFADTPAEAERHARDGPRAGDRRAHAARGAGRPARVGRQGVLRGRRVGRDPQAARDALQRHGRDRHRGGRRDAPRPRRARALLDDPAAVGVPGQGGHRVGRRQRLAAQPPRPDRHAARGAVPRARHDARGDQPAGRARGRLVRRARRAHGDGERGPRPPQGPARRRSASATRRPGWRASRRRSSSPARRSTGRTTAASRAT